MNNEQFDNQKVIVTERHHRGPEPKGLILGDVVSLASCIYQVKRVMSRGRFMLKLVGDDPDA